MTPFVYSALLLIASPLTVKVKGLPPGWKTTAHLMRGDELIASGMAFPDAHEDDQVVTFANNKKEAVAIVGSPRDMAADGTLTVAFPERAILVGEVRFLEGQALEGLIGNAGRAAPFEGSTPRQTFEQLGGTKFKIENGHFKVSVPMRTPGEVRFAGCTAVATQYVAAAHPTARLELPVGILEARVEDEKGKGVKAFNATALGVVLGGKGGSFKHAVLATCELQLQITAKGFYPQSVAFKVDRGGVLKLPPIVLRHK